ncbi:hypothetical protein SAMN04487864_10198 [Succiniclasticum ruminis]|uniref:Uncharacterized protein n=1 Tax=Succiniclasticum ruminis TaxID=40841 RepID=A0A1G6HMH7_9FIRM|nr:hypothetical protein [Succiniclasticum ruminis]SDB95469.1 hypothetical protein SAMN04487864_10198 [Succiniclasticum ruminis]
MEYSIKIEKKLKDIIENSYRDKKFEETLSGISALAYIYYQYNQFYTDEFLELFIEKVSKELNFPVLEKMSLDHNTILFYDGFGLDGRGLAYIYLKALCTLQNKKLIYITKQTAKNKQPLISEILKNTTISYYEENKGWVHRAKEINECILKYKPGIVFIYIPPWDVSAVGIFGLQNNLKRIQINLTDHAFWLGRNMFDICVEFREYGYSISKDYRYIPESKLTILPFYPHIDNCEFEGLPFDLTGHKMIFSGGSLYKTLSEDNKYYMILDEIIKNHNDVVFLYAGGDEKDKGRLNELIRKYPERVYWIKERKDFIKIIERCYFYLNTYPHIGGLMTQYAVAVGKLPITLKNGKQTEGVLLKEENSLGFYYNTEKELLIDVHKLLIDENYLHEREKELEGCLMTEQDFAKGVINILVRGKAEFVFSHKKIDIKEVEDIRKMYQNRFKSEYFDSAIANRRNKALSKYFPIMFLKRFFEVKLGIKL